MKPAVCAVFDVDDTLYLEREYVRSGFRAVGRWAAKWLQLPDFEERCWDSFVAGKRGSIFDEVLRDVGREPADELVSCFVDIYRTHDPSIVLAEDAADCLQALLPLASVAVITDGHAVSQSRKVEALGLHAFASPILLTGALGSDYKKPGAKAFQLTARLSPADVYLYVADNPLKDFSAPKQLGWMTVRVRRAGGLHCNAENCGIFPDYDCADCTGVMEILSQL